MSIHMLRAYYALQIVFYLNLIQLIVGLSSKKFRDIRNSFLILLETIAFLQ